MKGIEKDEFFYFCQRKPTFEECVLNLEREFMKLNLEGLIEIVNGIVEIKV